MRFGVPSESWYRAYARVPFVSLFRLVPATFSHGVQGHRPASFLKLCLFKKKKRKMCQDLQWDHDTSTSHRSKKKTEWQKEAPAE